MNAPLRLLFPALLFALSGCSLLGKPKNPPTVYAPRPAWTAQAAAPSSSVPFQLLVDAPQASATLDSNRIAVMPTPGVLQVYKAALWSDRVPLLLRSLLTEAFEKSGRIAGVGSYATGLRADYSLVTQILDFQSEYRDGTPVAVLRISAKLVDALSGRVVAARVFPAEQASASTATADVVHAFESALSTLLPQVVDWTLNEGMRARSSNAALETRLPPEPPPVTPAPDQQR
ncbi:MAG: ABC-type transport auxiliary lipoprotein family protein [Tahibacter sp.]